MKGLMRKEFALVVNVSSYFLVATAALVFVPTWPYSVIFVYGLLPAFFNAMAAREMRDLEFTFSLPVSRRQIVRARVGTYAVLILAMLVLMTFCVALRGLYDTSASVLGLGANFALIGTGFVVFGVFILTFFPLYFRDPRKVGIPFIIGCVPAVILGVAFQAAGFVPGLADVFGASAFVYVGPQLAVFAIGAVVFCLCVAFSCRLSEHAFSRFDL